MGYNSTIISKKKECKGCGRMDYIFSKGHCQECAKLASFNKRQEKENEKDGLSELRDKLDEAFSRFVRMKAADEKGVCECYTCGKRLHWTLMQCGHFIKRACMWLRWDTRNCRVQCRECNCDKSGNMGEYTKRIEKEKPGIVEILKEEAATVYKYTREELFSLINYYKTQIRILKK